MVSGWFCLPPPENSHVPLTLMVSFRGCKSNYNSSKPAFVSRDLLIKCIPKNSNLSACCAGRMKQNCLVYYQLGIQPPQRTNVSNGNLPGHSNIVTLLWTSWNLPLSKAVHFMILMCWDSWMLLWFSWKKHPTHDLFFQTSNKTTRHWAYIHPITLWEWEHGSYVNDLRFGGDERHPLLILQEYDGWQVKVMVIVPSDWCDCFFSSSQIRLMLGSMIYRSKCSAWWIALWDAIRYTLAPT